MSTVLNTDELSDGTKAVQAPIIGGSGEFFMQVAIGTPALSLSAILDR